MRCKTAILADPPTHLNTHACPVAVCRNLRFDLANLENYVSCKSDNQKSTRHTTAISGRNSASICRSGRGAATAVILATGTGKACEFSSAHSNSLSWFMNWMKPKSSDWSAAHSKHDPAELCRLLDLPFHHPGSCSHGLSSTEMTRGANRSTRTTASSSCWESSAVQMTGPSACPIPLCLPLPW